jgi:hypothetical protein
VSAPSFPHEVTQLALRAFPCSIATMTSARDGQVERLRLMLRGDVELEVDLTFGRPRFRVVLADSWRTAEAATDSIDHLEAVVARLRKLPVRAP